MSVVRSGWVQALIYCAGGVFAVLLITSIVWPGTVHVRGVFVPAETVDSGEVFWSRGYSRIDFATLVYRPLRVNLRLWALEEAPRDRIRVLVSANDVPVAQIWVTKVWQAFEFTVDHSPGVPLVVRVQSGAFGPGARGVGVGRAAARPAGVSRGTLPLAFVGLVLGAVLWLHTRPSWPWRDRQHVPVIALLTVIPMAHVAGIIGVYGVDVPYWDQWRLVPLLAALDDGTMRVSDLWAIHNEHRVLFPRLVMLGLAQLSGWNTRWEMAASLPGGRGNDVRSHSIDAVTLPSFEYDERLGHSGGRGTHVLGDAMGKLALGLAAPHLLEHSGGRRHGAASHP